MSWRRCGRNILGRKINLAICFCFVKSVTNGLFVIPLRMLNLEVEVFLYFSVVYFYPCDERVIIGSVMETIILL